MTRIGDSATPRVLTRPWPRAVLLTTLALLSALCCALPATASASDISFAGSVLGSDGSPVGGMEVSISGQGSSDTQLTGPDGRFELHAPAGIVTITLSRSLDGSDWSYSAYTSLTADFTDKVFRLPVLQTVRNRFRSVAGDPLPAGSVRFDPVTCGAGADMNAGFPLLSSPGPMSWPYFPIMTVKIPDAAISDGHSPNWQMYDCGGEPWFVTDVETASPGFYSGMEWSSISPGPSAAARRADVPVRSFSARLTLNTYNPFAGQTVKLTDSDGSTESTVTDPDGKFRLSDRPGTYDVSVAGVLNPSVRYSLTAPDVDMSHGFGPNWSYVGRINLDYDWTGIAVRDEAGHPVDGAFISGCTPIRLPILNVDETTGTQCLKMRAWGGSAGTNVLWGGMADITVRPPAGALLKPKTTTVSLDNDGPEYVAVTLEESDVPYVPDVPYDAYEFGAAADPLIEPSFDYGDAAPADLPTLPDKGADTDASVQASAAACQSEKPEITSAPRSARSTSSINIELNCLGADAIRTRLIVGSRRIGGLAPAKLSSDGSFATMRLAHATRLRLTRYLRSHPKLQARLSLTPVRDGVSGASRTIRIRG
ncbi:MAG: carboxypeptidase-like regulatory domain-containing protein [Solirubrobacterales bacterium]